MKRLFCHHLLDNILICQLFCIFIFFYLNTSCIICLSTSPSSLQEAGTIYAAEGSKVIIKCPIYQDIEIINNKKYHINASMLSFKHGGVNINNVVRNEKMASIHILNAQISASGNYYCYLNLPGLDPTLMKIIKLEVGKPPTLQKYNEFNCQSEYFRTLKCTWKANNYKTCTIYSLVVSIMQKNFVFSSHSCTSISVNSASCQWNTKYAELLKVTHARLVFRLETINIFGDLSQNFSIDYFSIVIPGRVSNLVFEEINSTSAYVTWDYPLTVANDKELQKMMAFKVSYLIHAHMQQEVDVGITNKPHYIITRLKPRTRYSIIIKSRFKTRKDWNVPPFLDNFQTVPEVPYEPPKSIPGAFELIPISKTRRDLRIYWEPVTENNYNGENFEYRVILFFDQKSEEYIAAKNNNTFYFYNLPSTSVYNIELYSSNEVGTSYNYSVLVVAPMIDISTDLLGVFVINNQNGTYQIFWTTYLFENISYTIFYCKTTSNKLDCKDKIEVWPILNINQSVIVMQLEDDENYKFGIAAMRGLMSTGIIWSQCHGFSDFNDKSNYYKEFHLETISDQTIEVRWELRCRALEIAISHFIIEYCPSAEEGICENNTTTTIIIKSFIRRARVTRLRGNKNYIFNLSAITKTGQVLSSPSAGIKTPTGALCLGIMLVIFGMIILALINIVRFGKHKWTIEQLIRRQIRDDWKQVKTPFKEGDDNYAPSSLRETGLDNSAFNILSEYCDSSLSLVEPKIQNIYINETQKVNNGEPSCASSVNLNSSLCVSDNNNINDNNNNVDVNTINSKAVKSGYQISSYQSGRQYQLYNSLYNQMSYNDSNQNESQNDQFEWDEDSNSDNCKDDDDNSNTSQNNKVQEKTLVEAIIDLDANGVTKEDVSWKPPYETLYGQYSSDTQSTTSNKINVDSENKDCEKFVVTSSKIIGSRKRSNSASGKNSNSDVGENSSYILYS